jgi:hypothetical protein
VASMLGSATAVTVLVRDVHSEETPFARLPLGIRPLTAKVAGVARTNCQRTFPAILAIGLSRQRH